MTAILDASDICAPLHQRGATETHRRRGATETHRRRGAPRGNRNALKSGRYTAKAKGERRRKRMLLRQLRAGLTYTRAILRAQGAAAKLAIFPSPPRSPGKKFSKIEKQFPQGGNRLPALPHMRGYYRILESGRSPPEERTSAGKFFAPGVKNFTFIQADCYFI